MITLESRRVQGGHRVRPTFLIVGAPKSGTTSLYHYLNQHPQVCMSRPKETRFFELEYHRGMRFYSQTYFKDCQGQAAIGEASPSYLYLPYVPARIKQQLPDAKLVAILRNPVDRAFSHWWMTFSMGAEKLSFEAAIKANLEQLRSGFSFDGADGEQLWRESIYWGQTQRTVRRRWYLDMGHYAKQLERYLALFPRSQMKVLLFSDLLQSPSALTSELAGFLGVSPEFELTDRAPRMAATPAIGLPLVRLARVTGTQQLIPKSIRSWLGQLLRRFSRKPSMTPSVRDWLVEYYYAYNRELESILFRDLSHWDR